jgi:hypothetical protein
VIKRVVLAVAAMFPVVVTAGCGDSPSSPGSPADAAAMDAAAMDAAAPYVSCDKHEAPDPACPAPTPTQDTACASAGLVCDYARSDGWDSCRCRDGGDGSLRWRCFADSMQYDCPLSRPQHGEPCTGMAGRSCAYLRDLACTCDADRFLPPNRNVTCACDKATETWRCANAPTLQSAGEGQKESEGVCIGTELTLTRPPVDESVPIANLTATDATAWCRWFAREIRGDGPPPPREPPLTLADGSVGGYGFIWCGDPIGACVAAVPEDLCLTSLRRRPCEATIQALTDCYLTLANRCEPVGRACAALRAAPGCLETVVQLNQDVGTTGLCTVPLR